LYRYAEFFSVIPAYVRVSGVWSSSPLDSGNWMPEQVRHDIMVLGLDSRLRGGDGL